MRLRPLKDERGTVAVDRAPFWEWLARRKGMLRRVQIWARPMEGYDISMERYVPQSAWVIAELLMNHYVPVDMITVSKIASQSYLMFDEQPLQHRFALLLNMLVTHVRTSLLGYQHDAAACESLYFLTGGAPVACERRRLAMHTAIVTGRRIAVLHLAGRHPTLPVLM